MLRQGRRVQIEKSKKQHISKFPKKNLEFLQIEQVRYFQIEMKYMKTKYQENQRKRM